jgi:hypothetical protein
MSVKLLKTRNENLLALAVECSLPVFVNNEILLWRLMYEKQSCEQLVSEVSNVLPYYIYKGGGAKKSTEAGTKYHERLATLLSILIRLCVASAHDWKVRAPKVAVILVTAYSRI